MDVSTILLALSAGLMTIFSGVFSTLLSRRARQTTKNVESAISATFNAVRSDEAVVRLARRLVTEIPTEGLRSTPQRPRPPAARTEESAPTETGEVLLSAAERRARMWSIIEKLITSYHDQALDQARIQFWFSIVAAAVGFAFIMYMVMTATSSDLVVILRAVPGAAIDIVASLFLKQAADTRRRATELYDRLRDDNKQAEALDLVDTISDSKVRSAVKANLALHMAGVVAPDLGAILSKSGTQSRHVSPPNKSFKSSRPLDVGLDGSASSSP